MPLTRCGSRTRAFEALDEPRQIDRGMGGEQQMQMRRDYPDRHYPATLLNRQRSQEPAQKGRATNVDEWTAVESSPNKVIVESMAHA